MSSESQASLLSNHSRRYHAYQVTQISHGSKAVRKYDAELRAAETKEEFHGDATLADEQIEVTTKWQDIGKVVLPPKNWKSIGEVFQKYISTKPHEIDMKAGSKLVAAMPENGELRNGFVEKQVMEKYNRMLHPPLTYLGDAFQYRTVDGKFNSVLHPHLGQAGAPYAKTVPSKARLLGAQPDPGDIFDRLMAREEKGRVSASGLSSMLIYHATIIIHDIFRTNNKDKNISDSSSYLDLSPLYGYTEEMQRKVRDGKYKLGFLKPDTFAEDRLLRQPPGVCIMLVMYNRYHNYAATQLRHINENGRFSVPKKFLGEKLVAVARECVPAFQEDSGLQNYLHKYEEALKDYRNGDVLKRDEKYTEEKLHHKIDAAIEKDPKQQEKVAAFKAAYDAAWNKLDDDLFNTARLITCGMYINVSIHDYLRALMGFHQYDTTFTLDPRVAINEPKKKDVVSRGIGNQVTVEFNLLYRFHCAISLKDEEYTEDVFREEYGKYISDVMKGWDEKKSGMTLDQYLKANWDPKDMTLNQFLEAVKKKSVADKQLKEQEPWEKEFGLERKGPHFARNKITGLFDDQKMVDELDRCMKDPISNFGPRNVPKSLRSVEILGILQARKWEIGTLNDFREFFGMKRHKTFADISKSEEIQQALRDLYDHPDKVELYPGVFCEGDKDKNLDPGPSDTASALWAAIFSDAITLVRSDRFYTVDWNTNSLTSWGMNEVTPNNKALKSSVFHRLIQRAFPEWYSYDSVRFFHPFYTEATNTDYAKKQNYIDDFKVGKDSEPVKPKKPVYLSEYAEVKAVLSQQPEAFVNPACLNKKALPLKVFEIVDPEMAKKFKTKSKLQSLFVKDGPLAPDPKMVMKYFATITREIIKRQVIKIDKTHPIYQIDVIRDMAIPVITRFVADFLGFSDLVKTENNPYGKFSENEIYQHIMNCQVFLAYNVDETKMWKRRAAFKESMKFLYGLAEEGTIKEANRFAITKALFEAFQRKDVSEEKKMKEFSFTVAQRILKAETDTGRAAAVLLLTALDGVFNSVLAFSTVLEYFLKGLETKEAAHCDWIKLQGFALEDTEDGDKKITDMVMKAQRQSVNIPVIRKVASRVEVKVKGKTNTYNKDQIIVLDVHAASRNDADFKTPGSALSYGCGLSEGFVHFDASSIAIRGLTAMIKVLGQTVNLRRGHDSQGQLKRIRLEPAFEGYAAFMAPMRMEAIFRDVMTLRAHKPKETDTPEQVKRKRNAEDMDIDRRVLRPRTDTYLTPEWDEMIPFPMTWKVRFNGYGKSNYDFSSLNQSQYSVVEELWSPQGASHFGGSFADTVCVCNTPGTECKCKGAQAPTVNGEGTHHDHVHGLIHRHMCDDHFQHVALASGVKVGGCGM